MKLLIVVLCAFVCAFEAAKYKYFVQNGGDFIDGIWVLHDRNFDLFVSGEKPSKGLLNYIQSGKSSEYLAEIKSKKGVSAAELVPKLSASAVFYVQTDRETDRVTFVGRTSSTSAFLAALGSRTPTDVVTSFTGDVKQWMITSTAVTQSSAVPPAWGQFSGRQICPTNDATVYVKLENVGDYALAQPIFWTQAGGSNDVFWPGGAASAGFTDLLATGKTDIILGETRMNEDVCYSWVATNAALTEQESAGVWEIPVASGQKLFFALNGKMTNADKSVSTWVFGSANNGIVLWKDGALQSAFSANDHLAAYTATAGKVQLVNADASESVHAFVFDHFPTGNEFPEEKENIEDGYDIGLCGSYVLNEEGIYEPKEWQNHPYDCTDQEGGDKCMFCKGRANDKVRSVCLPRLGSGCNAAFNSPPRPTFCNLEFECPASTVSFPLFVILSLLGLLFFAL